VATALKEAGFTPAELIDTADIPGGGKLRLMRHGEDFAILFGEEQLMGSWVSGSEEALATLAFARLPGVKAPRFLIGGLGMGFTLAATLAVVPANATVMVAELVPKIVGWANGHLAHVFGSSLKRLSGTTGVQRRQEHQGQDRAADRAADQRVGHRRPRTPRRSAG
jgi:hypothetical protein